MKKVFFSLLIVSAFGLFAQQSQTNPHRALEFYNKNLALSTTQYQQIEKIITDSEKKMAAAQPGAQKSVKLEMRKQIMAVLTPAQVEKMKTLKAQKKADMSKPSTMPAGK